MSGEIQLVSYVHIALTFISECGYDHATAGHKTRQNAVDFTGCLAHVEVTYLRATQKIIRVRGYFDHN